MNTRISWGGLALLALAGNAAAQTPPDLLPAPPASVCVAPTAPTEPGNVHMFPGRWWNPQRNGIGWDFFYNDGQSTMYLTWFTFDPQGRPVWLHGEARPLQFNAVTGERTWRSNLYSMRWRFNASGPVYRPVGAVSVTFPNQTTTRAAVRWRWDQPNTEGAAGIAPVGSVTYDECIFDTFRDQRAQQPGRGTINQAFSSNWFYQGVHGDPLVGWGVDLLIDRDPASGHYIETAAAAIFDVNGRPVWLQSEDDWGTDAPPDDTLAMAGKGALRYFTYRLNSAQQHPAITDCTNAGTACGPEGNRDAVPGPDSYGQFARRIDGAASGRMKLVANVPSGVTGIGAVNWPPPNDVQDPDLPAEVPVMRFDANHVIVDKSVCRVPGQNDLCTFTVSWSSNDPNAQIVRLDLNNGGAPSAFASGLSSLKDDLLPVGARVQYEISYQYNGSGPLTRVRTPEVRVLLGNGIADANVENIACKPNGNNGCDLPAHDPGTGAIAGEASTDGGAATYTMPITVPPGRNGMQPELALAYSSRSGNGIAGLGWSLSGQSSIHRCPRTVAEDGIGKAAAVGMGANDALCLDGQRLVVSDVNGNVGVDAAVDPSYGLNGTRYRTEINNFARVTQYGGDLTSAASCFKVEHKSGMVAYYGGVSDGGSCVSEGDSRQVPENLSAPLSWQIERRQDASGNTINYSYLKFGAGEKLLRYIHYTGHGAERGNRQVFLDYAPRPAADQGRSFMAGGKTERTQRLTRIVTSVAGIAVNSYALDYTDPVSTGQGNLHSGRSALQTITQCATGGDDDDDPTNGNGSDEVCLPPTVVNWNDMPPDHVLRPLQVAGLPDPAPSPAGSSAGRTFDPIGDLDGDGVREVFVRQYEADGNPHYWLVKQNADRAVQGTLDITALAGSLAFVGPGMQADFDGDGRSDMLAHIDGTLGVYRWNLARGAGFGTTAATTFSATPLTNVVGGIQLLSTDDISGDGYADLLLRRQGTQCGASKDVELPAGAGARANTYVICYYRNTTSAPGSISFANGVVVHTWSHEQSGGLSAVGDLNGDGRSDFVIENEIEVVGGPKDVIETVLLSHEKNLPPPAGCSARPSPAAPVLHACNSQQMGLPTDNWAGYRPGGVVKRWHDVNGDGLSDLLYAVPGNCVGRLCSRGSWKVQIANGKGFNPELGITGNDDALLMTTGMSIDRLRYAGELPTADADSDGKPDLLFPVALAARQCSATEMTYYTSENSTDCDMYNHEPTAPSGQMCRRVVWVCSNDPAVDLGGGGPTYTLPTRASLPDAGAFTTDNLYTVRTSRASFSAADHSLYYMDGLRFVATKTNNGTVDGYEAQRFSLNASAGSNRAAHRVAMTLESQVAINDSDDLYGDGLGDPSTRVGCSGSAASATTCRFVGDGTTGPASFAVAPTPNAAPVPFTVTDLNSGLRRFVNENVGVLENTASAPTLPGLVRSIVNGFNETTTWTYYPLSSRGKRSASHMPLYRIPMTPGSGYVDNEHFYFQSTMPVVGNMSSSPGNGTLQGARTWRYSYAEAMYNRLGRGFQGFRAILREQAVMTGDVPRALREVTVFHQKFPLTGRVERTRSGRPTPVNQLASLDLKDWVLPFTEETFVWGCRLAAPATCPTAGAPNVSSFQYPFLHEQTTTSYDPADIELANPGPQLPRTAQVVQRNYSPSGSTGWDAYGNLRDSENEASDLAEATDAIAFVTSKRTRSQSTYVNTTNPSTWWPGKLESTESTIFPVVYGAAHQRPDDVVLPEQTLSTVYEWNSDRTQKTVTVEGADLTLGTKKVFTYPSVRNYGLPSAVTDTYFDSTRGINVTRTVQTAYETEGYFPSAVTDAAGTTASLTHRTRDGQLRQTIAPTLVRTYHRYDAFGRLFLSDTFKRDSLNGPETRFAQPVHKAWNRCPGTDCTVVGGGGRQIGNPGTAAEYLAAYRVTTVQNGSPTQVSWYDMLGREIKSAVRGFDGTFVATLSEYDSMGTLAMKSVPFFLSTPNAQAPAGFTFTYDRAGRLTRKTSPDGEIAVGQTSPGTGYVIADYRYAGQRSTVQISNSRGSCVPANLCVSVARYHGVAGLMRTDDALNGKTRYWSDAAGRPAAIADANTNARYPDPIPAGRVTRASYNKFGHRIQSADPNQGAWNFVYNGAGELVRQTDARGINTWIYRDHAGRPYAQTSLLTATQGAADEHYRDEWSYDPATGLLGQMRRCITTPLAVAACTDANATWKESYTYGNGRLVGASTTQAVPGGSPFSHAMLVHYDANHGREKAVEYPGPDGLKVQRIYTRYGALRDVLDADTGERFWGVGAADAWGNVTRQDYGNGMVGEYSYDPVSGRPVRLQWRSGANAQTLVADRVEYGYDTLGNLSAQRRTIPGSVNATESYVYDKLQRLKSSSVPGSGYSVAYDYDALGNLRHKGDFSRLDPADGYRYAGDAPNDTTGCGPNVATTILMRPSAGFDRVNYRCDANGNVITAQPADTAGQPAGGARDIRYDPTNRPRYISDPAAPGSPTATFMYAPDGRRVYEALGERYFPTAGDTGTTRNRYIVQGQRGYQRESSNLNGSNATDRYELGGVSVVMRSVSGQGRVRDVAYKALDRLGSPLGVMDAIGRFQQRSESGATGNATTQLTFSPFGAARARDFQPREPVGEMSGRLDLVPATRLGFTGHEHLDSLGVIHMNGRIYDHRVGRFLSVDPFIQFPANSQSLNPYSYIMNNPMAGTDPTGYRIRRGRQFESGDPPGKGPCMGDALCQAQQAFDGPLNDFRNSVGFGRTSRTNGHLRFKAGATRVATTVAIGELLDVRDLGQVGAQTSKDAGNCELAPDACSDRARRQEDIGRIQDGIEKSVNGADEAATAAVKETVNPVNYVPASFGLRVLRWFGFKRKADVAESVSGKAVTAGPSLPEGPSPHVSPGKQGKHTIGHNNYTPGRSVLTADPSELGRRAGTGQQVGNVAVGKPGSKERIDFGEEIGTYVDQAGNGVPTTVGIIHYAKDGMHIVPARP